MTVKGLYLETGADGCPFGKQAYRIREIWSSAEFSNLLFPVSVVPLKRNLGSKLGKVSGTRLGFLFFFCFLFLHKSAQNKGTTAKKKISLKAK